MSKRIVGTRRAVRAMDEATENPLATEYMDMFFETQRTVSIEEALDFAEDMKIDREQVAYRLDENPGVLGSADRLFDAIPEARSYLTTKIAQGEDTVVKVAKQTRQAITPNKTKLSRLVKATAIATIMYAAGAAVNGYVGSAYNKPMEDLQSIEAAVEHMQTENIEGSKESNSWYYHPNKRLIYNFPPKREVRIAKVSDIPTKALMQEAYTRIFLKRRNN